MLVFVSASPGAAAHDLTMLKFVRSRSRGLRKVVLITRLDGFATNHNAFQLCFFLGTYVQDTRTVIALSEHVWPVDPPMNLHRCDVNTRWCFIPKPEAHHSQRPFSEILFSPQILQRPFSYPCHHEMSTHASRSYTVVREDLSSLFRRHDLLWYPVVQASLRFG